MTDIQKALSRARSLREKATEARGLDKLIDHALETHAAALAVIEAASQLILYPEVFEVEQEAKDLERALVAWASAVLKGAE